MRLLVRCGLVDVRTAWWAYVTLTPEAKRMAVFRSGIENGFKGHTPVGGHAHPVSRAGANLL